jgi:outer membrane protein OmpA-like peptidoglycan-associated protein
MKPNPASLLLPILFSPALALAQPSAPAHAQELIDVVSFFNGGYYYTFGKQINPNKAAGQIVAISAGNNPKQWAKVTSVNAIFRDDLNEKTGEQKATLYYAFAAPAAIETFRISGEDSSRDQTARRFEFAVSQSPTADFQTVAVFDTPESYVSAPRTSYDFSIPVKQKLTARYVRITFSGTKYGRYWLSRFSAYGRFNEPVKLRKDFSGIYYLHGNKSRTGSQADLDMTSQQKGTGFDPYLILHQKDSQIHGCYVYAANNGGGGKGLGSNTFKKGLLIREISEVLGTVEGGIENNVFRFTRTHAKDGAIHQGALALPPVAEGIVSEKGRGTALVSWNPPVPGEYAGERKGNNDYFGISLIRFSDSPIPCAVAGGKEKTAAESMQENLEKTGKVQLYGINFDFDSDTLRPESGAVLDEVVKVAKANPAWKFEVGGHTDSIGSADYNLKLSDRRAASVVRYLAGKGIDASRLAAKGYGATRPLVPESADNDSARAHNRRVELIKR